MLNLFISSSSRTRPCLCGLSRLAWHPHQHWSGHFRRGTHLENCLSSTLWRTSQIKPLLVFSLAVLNNLFLILRQIYRAATYTIQTIEINSKFNSIGNKQQYHAPNSAANWLPNANSSGAWRRVIIAVLLSYWYNILNGEENNSMSFPARKVSLPT